MSIGSKLEKLLNNMPEHVRLIAVSKTHPSEVIMEAYHAGHRHFGENKVQELTNKATQLPDDIVWHMIGHLQSNKVKYIAPFIGMIHGVDSLKLLKVINKEAAKNNRIIPCLLQVHIAKESTKFGFDSSELAEFFETVDRNQFTNVKINGLMGMATFTDDMNIVREEFRSLKSVFDIAKEKYFKDDTQFTELSMGMSDDYGVAIEEGSTIVRIGSAIFGER